MTHSLGNKKKSKLAAKLAVSFILHHIPPPLSAAEFNLSQRIFTGGCVCHSCRSASLWACDCLTGLCTHTWVSSINIYLSALGTWRNYFFFTFTALPNRLLSFPVAPFFPSCASWRIESYDQWNLTKRYSISAICWDSGHLQYSDAHLYTHSPDAVGPNKTAIFITAATSNQ